MIMKTNQCMELNKKFTLCFLVLSFPNGDVCPTCCPARMSGKGRLGSAAGAYVSGTADPAVVSAMS